MLNQIKPNHYVALSEVEGTKNNEENKEQAVALSEVEGTKNNEENKEQ